jgi:hypothetical protein
MDAASRRSPGAAVSGGSVRTVLLCCWSLLGCAGAAAEQPGVASPTSSSASAELSGVWSEYWAVAGQADTQRFTFSDNGEFRWSAAPSLGAPQAGTPVRKQGKFELHRSEQRRWLVLHVGETELAGCDSACEGEEGAFHIQHSPALLEELEVSDCPPNLEAQQLDAHYACLALGDRAFWRKPAGASPAHRATPNAN